MNILDYAQTVLHMRCKQQEFFRLTQEAKSDPSKYALRSKVLKEAKELEAKVDLATMETIQHQKNTQNLFHHDKP